MSKKIKTILVISLIVNFLLVLTNTVTLTLYISGKAANSSGVVADADADTNADSDLPEEVQYKTYPGKSMTNVNIRLEPDAKSTKLGVLTANEPVDVIEVLGDWAKILYNDEIAYVKASYISGLAGVPSSGISTEVTSDMDVVALPEEEKKEEPEVGVWFSFEMNEYGETIPYYKMNTPNGYVYLSVPSDAVDLVVNGSTLSYHVKNDWADISFLYDIDSEITTDLDTERKVDSITASLPSSLPSGYSGLYTIQDIRFNGQIYTDVSNVWYKEVGTCGASYFYEASTYTTEYSNIKTMDFSQLYEEAFNYIDGMTFHEKISVDYFNFKDYYNSLDTSMAQTRAEGEYNEIERKITSSFHTNIPGTADSFTSSVYGIINCMSRKVTVK